MMEELQRVTAERDLFKDKLMKVKERINAGSELSWSRQNKVDISNIQANTLSPLATLSENNPTLSVTEHQIQQPHIIAQGHFKIENSINQSKKTRKRKEKIREQPTKDYPHDTVNSSNYSFTRDKQIKNAEAAVAQLEADCDTSADRITNSSVVKEDKENGPDPQILQNDIQCYDPKLVCIGYPSSGQSDRQGIKPF